MRGTLFDCFRGSQRVTFYDYYDSDIPVFSKTVEQLEEGVCLKIFGYMPENSEKFAIHLIVDNTAMDIALRINPRLPQNFIVRNSRISYKWGRSETASTSAFALSRGRFFRIHILTTKTYYLIALNGVHFAQYQHRVPYESVKFLRIYGDVSNIYASTAVITAYPERQSNIKFTNLSVTWISMVPTEEKGCKKKFNRCPQTAIPLPFYGVVSTKQLWNRKHLRFEGRVKLLPVCFTIQLQKGQNVWPHPIVPFHFSYKFRKHHNNLNKNLIVRKVYHGGRWFAEESSSLISDLCPGRVFSLVIAPGKESFEVYVNRKFVFDFKHYVDFNFVDTVYIDGDILLWEIMIEFHNTHIYFNPKCKRQGYLF